MKRKIREETTSPDKIRKKDVETEEGDKGNPKVFHDKKEMKVKPGPAKEKLEKPDWNKMKSEKKQLRDARRKKQNTLYNTYKESKKLWEQMRRSDCSSQDQIKLAERIYESLKGNIKMVVRSHDMARIIQWILKLGSEELKEKIATEILDDIVRLASSKYAIHTIKGLIRNCSNGIKKKIFNKFSGNVVKLCSSKVAASFMEEMYSKVCTPQERFILRKELYGNVFYSDVQNRSSVLSSFNDNPEEKAAIIKSTYNTLQRLIEKKHSLQLSIVHSVIYDYLCHCGPTEKSELIESIKGFLNGFLTSKDGAKVAAFILWESSKKEKKSLVKELKGEINKLATGEHSSLFLLTLFDSVDDTVLLKKVLIPGLLANLEALASDDHGRKVLIYLISHRNPAFFHPSDIEWLKQSESSAFVKKSSDIRSQELKEAVLDPLLQTIISNIKFWLKDSKIGMVTLAALKESTGEILRNAYNVIADFIVTSNETNSIIEHPGIHMIIKKIISYDKERSNFTDNFSSILTGKLNQSVIEKWVTINRGCFLLVFILESNKPDECDLLKNMIRQEKKILAQETTAGAELLKTLI